MIMTISPELLLRCLNIKEFYFNRSMMQGHHTQAMVSALTDIQRKRVELNKLISQQQGTDDTAGGGSTIKGLRAKNDQSLRQPASTRLTRTR